MTDATPAATVERIRREAFMEAAAVANAFPWWTYTDEPTCTIHKRIAEALEAIAGKGTWPQPGTAKGPTSEENS